MKNNRVHTALLALLIIMVMALVPIVRSIGARNSQLFSAATTVGGIITSDTNWTEANSPYIVTSSVLVSQGVTLTIEPGVVVKFELAKAMQVDGQLIARGTDVKPIVFTSIRDDIHGGDSNGDGSSTLPAPGDWAYILFTDPSVDATFDADGNYISGSILEHSVITFGGGRELTGFLGAIRIDFSAPFLNYNVVSNNANHGVCINQGGPKIANSNISHNGYGDTYSGSGICANNYPDSATITIVGNTLTDNSREGIYIYNYGGSVSYILNNTVAGNGGIGISVDGAAGGSGGTHTFVIMGNIIRYNGAGGIAAREANLVITNNIVIHNSASSGMYVTGVGYMLDTNMIITNNIIAYNTASYAGAVSLSTSEHASSVFSYNSIVGNVATEDSIIYVSKDPTHPEYTSTFTYNLVTQNNDKSTISNSIKIYGSPVINYNNLFGNFHSYEVYNTNAAGPSHSDAKNNWWGTSNATEIQAKIYDWSDDVTKGIVDYAPYSNSIRTDAPISPPLDLTLTPEAANFSLAWKPNPEPDLAGYKIYYDTDSGYPYRYSIDVGNVTTYTLTGLPPNAVFFTVTAYDTDADGTNDLFEGHESWYAYEAIAFPSLIILSPENKTYNVSSIPLTFTVDRPASLMGYSLDGQANVTVAGNTTLSGLPDGSHGIVVYADGTPGSMGGSAPVYFAVDTTPPSITNLVQTPSPRDVGPQDTVRVNATVTDALSGLKQVILNYTNDNGTWVTVTMTNIEGTIWNASIPAFPYSTYVNYTIAAEDNAGNHVTTEEALGYQYQYRVIPEFPSSLILPIFMIATLLAVTVHRRERLKPEPKRK